MHIIIDGTTTQDQMAYAGPGQYAKNIILSLAKEFPNTQYSVLLFEEKESTLDTEISKYKNVTIERVGQFRLNDYKNDITYIRQTLPVIRKIRRKDSIYFCPYFWRNFPSDIMPTVLFVHDMNLPMFNMYSQQSPIHNFIRKIQYWKTLNKSLKCQHILCNSKTTLNDFLKYYPQYPKGNISVSYLGVDLEEKESSLENILPKDYKERGYVIYLGGGINKTKNSEGVLKGYISFLKHLNKEKPPYLVIAGGKFEDTSKKEVQDLYKIIEDNNIKEHVIFTGFYEDKNKYSLLKESFAFIHLSFSEGFGLSAVEALRAKAPTILCNSPVYMELFKDVSIMVDGNDYEEVGKAIYDVYMNPKEYEVLVQKGYTLSRAYTWKSCAQVTHKVFDKINNGNN
jgi:glycosyltransferase involved in cell wall biosynthesis